MEAEVEGTVVRADEVGGMVVRAEVLVLLELEEAAVWGAGVNENEGTGETGDGDA